MGTSLKGSTTVMSGGDRGIGLAVLTAAARDGVDAVILAKSGKPDPRPPGTVHMATRLSRGWAAEYAASGMAANRLRPQTAIETAAVTDVLGGESLTSRSRGPEITPDAAVVVLSRPPHEETGLTVAGVKDLVRYGGGDHPEPDLFVDP